MSKLLKQFHKKAAKIQARLLFPETNDLRILKALKKLSNLDIAKLYVLESQSDFEKVLKKHHASFNCQKINFLDSKKLVKNWSEQLVKIRQDKGLTLSESQKLLKNPNYQAVMALQENLIDGVITGSYSSTGDSLRPAFQVLKTNHKSSGAFLMINQGHTIIFADCAVNPNPNSVELAQIAIDTANLAKNLGLIPRLALLSYSSHGSSNHPEALKVAETAKILRRKKVKFLFDGELQADAALIKSIANFKAPKSAIKGNANILIFPNLEAGNIGYKLVERLGGYQAIGGLILGLKKPFNDLSRGCSIEDIIDLTALTCLQTKHQ